MIPEHTAIITTSWDDGHPLDDRMAGLLAGCGIRGTFYVPRSCGRRPVMSERALRELASGPVEIGSHTISHPVLTTLDEAACRRELRDSKLWLEDLLSREMTAFCYPKGKYSAVVAGSVRAAGYRLARTTASFRTELSFSPFAMPVSVQFAPHGAATLLRHIVREGNVHGLSAWLRICHLRSALPEIIELLFRHVLAVGGVLHIWGHSWEIEQFSLWEDLRQTLNLIAGNRAAMYLTNSEVLTTRHTALPDARPLSTM